MSRAYFHEHVHKAPAVLPERMARLSINELSRFISAEAHQSDPHNVEKRIWVATKPVMQRLHEYDMIGHFQSLFETRLVSFPAIAEAADELAWTSPFGVRKNRRVEGHALHEEREPLAILEELRAAMGPRMFASQYLQMPAPPGGSIVKPEWFQRYDPTNLPEFDTILQSWDTASRASQLSDYSVCTTWGKKDRQLYLLHVLRKRLEYPELKRAVIDQAHLFGADKVLVEDASSGLALIQDLRNDGCYLVEAVKPKGDKVIRLSSVTAAIEAGQVFVPQHANWFWTTFTS